MAPRPHSARRQASDELAQLLASDDGLREARLLQLLKLVEEPPRLVPAETQPAESIGPEPIGIWQPRSRDGSLVFERVEPDRATGLLWDPRPTLEATKAPGERRICFLGESAAAGWFYAPHVTPASVLESYLRRASESYTVVNLARVDLDQEGLVALTRASRQLNPDSIVIYAGNNWGLLFGAADQLGVWNYHAAARAYRTHGPVGLMRVSSDAVRHAATETMAAIARAAGDVPVVFVVPEVNLADWERARPVPWLPGDSSARWHELHAESRAAARRGDWRSSSEHARVMIALDGGCCATSHRLLANALAAAGEMSEAREAARAEVRARAWDNHPHTPSATPEIQEAIRVSAAQHGFRCVDLPALAGDFAGRDVMLDYCHLTLEGMALAMRAVARQVLSLGGVDDVASSEWPSPVAPREVDARARFLAGLYGTHWSTRRTARDGLSTRWLDDALDVWPGIADEMRAYVSTRCAPPHWLRYSIAQQRVRESGADMDGRVLAGPNIDVHAVEAIRAALEARGHAVDGGFGAHDPEAGPVDLLDDAYAWNVLDRWESTAGFSHPKRAFFRALWPVSRFSLAWNGASSIAISITARLVAIAGSRSGEAVVTINGQRVAAVALSERWRSETIVVPADVPHGGLNRLSIRWPSLPPDGDAAMREITRRLELGIPADLHPTFGEVFRLEARRV